MFSTETNFNERNSAGLVTYRETALLYDPKVSSARAKQRVGTVVAHEQAHMWFGDLVTCEWFSNLWLNEGFARYFQYFATALVSNFPHSMSKVPLKIVL